ncbi:MAG TPA: amino acid permease [Candidatus Hydrogenedentes bacterium]|nr:amino acid permease [Candidatus Hydrogenedentota bacterium]
MKHFFERKSLELLLEEMQGEHRLHRALGPVALTALGIGTIIGAGIFVVTGQVARDVTGPAIIMSLVFSGFACVFAALCYAEFASMAPIAGSAYTYAYATLGEVFAWIIGWDLIVEYTIASSTVAHGWSAYFQKLLHLFGLELPKMLSLAPFDGNLHLTGTLIDLPAVIISAILTVVLVIGIRESAWVNGIMVLIKLSVVLLVILVGVFYIHPENWTPFAPYGWKGLSFFGDSFIWGELRDGKPVGVLAGAGMMFFAYIGFDAVSTQAEEARNPHRDVPIGIILSLLICTALYIAVSAVITGMVPYDHIDRDAPVAAAFMSVGLPWAQFVISVGALTGITSVQLVLMLSQPRVLLAMSRDGMLPPKFFAAVHPRFKTPWKTTIMTGVAVATISGLLPLRILLELVNIGTLLAFVIVCLSVLVMRRIRPDAERHFKCPFVPFVPIMGTILCLILMFSLPSENWLRLMVWFAIGFVVYFFYGRHHSVLAKRRRKNS